MARAATKTPTQTLAEHVDTDVAQTLRALHKEAAKYDKRSRLFGDYFMIINRDD